MTISAIGPIGFDATGSLAQLAGIPAALGASASGLDGSSAIADPLDRLLELINSTMLEPGTKVAISDTASTLLQADGGTSNSNMGELAQALIVALMMQLLIGTPSH